jgi:hypothetical protein
MSVDMDAWSKARIDKFLNTRWLHRNPTIPELADLLLDFEKFLGECEDKRMRD